VSLSEWTRLSLGGRGFSRRSTTILKATQKEVTLRRGVSTTFWFLGVVLLTGWAVEARAAETLNLFPDPIKVAINVVVFLLLIYPTSRFLLRPLVRTLEERERRTEGALRSMETLLGEAAQLRQTLEARLDEARERARTQRAAVLQQGEEEERQELVQAREEAAHKLEEARAEMATELDAARQTLRADAESLSRELASKVLGRPL
jgi:F-type H+-transporting ATPase subunit b